MRYLLAVNALVAFGLADHVFHDNVSRWVRDLVDNGEDELASCAITELGFVRVVAQAPQYGMMVSEAKMLLRRMKVNGGMEFTFLVDDQDAARLPGWVKTAKQTTDGHLAQLAKANGAVLATLDRGIPGAFLIPQS